MDHRDLALAGALAPGTLIGDRFEVERLAGEGGMATVYRARDGQTGEAVAVKLLRAEAGENAERLVREARVLARLGHPGIVRYVDHGTTANGELYLAMEWLEGEDLSQRLKRGPLSVEETLALTRRAVDALAAAHAQDLVHRDLKPSNLFLPAGEAAQVKVLDFGIVRLSQATIVATATGMILGTPAYMAPEQARGERLIDARADVFSLGCVVAECLTGKQVFSGEHALAVLARILLEEAPRVSESLPVPQGLDDLVAAMLAKDPAARPANAGALLALIDAIDLASPLTGAVATGPAPGLTAGEQRVLAVVLVAGSPATRREIPQTYHLVAGRHGGRIERLADGSLLVAMSGSATATDMVREAARCALALRDLSPGVAIALATGRGSLAERLPVGDVVDRAVERLRSGRVEDPGVRIDEVSAALMGARFEVRVDDRGPQVSGERDLEDETYTLLGRATSCVGRERELGTLAGTWEECIQEPMAHAVVVTAGAGVGKSRLRSEFLRRVLDEGVPIEVLRARGDPITAGSPFGLVGQLIRRAARVADAEPPPVRQQKLQTRVSRRAAPQDVRRMSEFLAELMGAPIAAAEASPELQAARQDPRVMGDQMQRAFQEFIALECQAQPMLIVLEDLQWGDAPSVRFVDGILRVLRDRPLFVIAMGRPEIEDLFPRLWSERGAQSLRLGELTARAAAKLVREVLGPEIPDETVDRVVSQAAGNAFYLEELIRAVAEGRTGAMPETVVAMAQARLELLAPELRRLLRAASVFGDATWRNGVEVLLGGRAGGGAVDELLRTAVEHEVLVSANESRFSTERQYRFRHALMREAAYAALTDEDRVLGHRLAGDWLERAGEAEAAVLAEHFDRGGAPARAVPWYVEASRQALNGHDMVAALARAARGVACGAADGDLVRLLTFQTQAHLWRGEHRDELDCAVQAMTLSEAGSAHWCLAAGMAMQASVSVGDSSRLIGIVEQVMAETRKPGAPEPELVTAMARAVKALLPVGEYALAEACVAWLTSRGAEIAKPGTLQIAQLHVARGDMARVRGDLGAFLESRERALEIFNALGQERSACVARENIGYAYLQLGMYAESERALSEGLALARRMELRATAMVALNNLGLARALVGQLEEGAKMEEEALKLARAMKNPRVAGGVLLYQARIQMLAGNLERAEAEARAAIEALAQAPPLRSYAYGVLSEVLRVGGRIEEAKTESDRAMEILDALGNLEEGETLVMVNRAECLAATGDAAAAHAILARACERLRAEADRITDPRYRSSYLENVPDHRRALSLASEWNLPEAGV